MDIELYELNEPGTDNERVVFRVNNDCNLAKFLVYDTNYLDRHGRLVAPMHRIYRFPDLDIRQEEVQMIRLYTKKYYESQTFMDPDGNNCLILSWNLNNPILTNSGHSITLIEIDNEEFKSITQVD